MASAWPPREVLDNAVSLDATTWRNEFLQIRNWSAVERGRQYTAMLAGFRSRKGGHGTHCAGTIGSKDYGVVKKVALVGVTVFNTPPAEDNMAGATTTDILNALEYGGQGVSTHGKPSVVNLSLGGGPSEAMDNAITTTVRAGVAVCCAAGNETSLVETTSPARSPLALTVAGHQVYLDRSRNNETNTISRTSMACPHVVGVTASILSSPAMKSKTPLDVASELLILADKNKIYGIDGIKGRTVDAIAHLAI
ncbi:peptidase S8/S53 domain-containing protein [Coniochaeta sp. 2T2.1]|nr:peptidase S8/S53 domain-containing protein [Coniochaeta sp. 2T2.1]